MNNLLEEGAATRMTGQSGGFYAVARKVSTKHHEERPKSTECSALVTKCHAGTTHAGALLILRLPSGTAPLPSHTVAYDEQILQTSSKADVRANEATLRLGTSRRPHSVSGHTRPCAIQAAGDQRAGYRREVSHRS